MIYALIGLLIILGLFCAGMAFLYRMARQTSLYG